MDDYTYDPRRRYEYPKEDTSRVLRGSTGPMNNSSYPPAPHNVYPPQPMWDNSSHATEPYSSHKSPPQAYSVVAPPPEYPTYARYNPNDAYAHAPSHGAPLVREDTYLPAHHAYPHHINPNALSRFAPPPPRPQVASYPSHNIPYLDPYRAGMRPLGHSQPTPSHPHAHPSQHNHHPSHHPHHPSSYGGHMGGGGGHGGSASANPGTGGSNAQGRAINKHLLDILRDRVIDAQRLDLLVDTYVERMDCVNLATLLFHTGKKRMILLPMYLKRIADRLLNLKEELRAREASNALYGLK
eukprot:gene36421-44181_t